MARTVASALSDGVSALVEAPTGTGKSLAYLVPAALFARRNGIKVMVATHTKNLQDQLGGQDLPLTAEATGIPDLRWRVVKGQENYLCTRRTLAWLDEGPALTDTVEERSVRLYASAFLEQTDDGDLERFLPWHAIQGPHVSRAVEHMRSTSATCLHERCPHFSTCFYQDVVHEARKADVLVVNHALALAWPDRYPAFEHLVVDEAHALEDVATSFFSLAFDPVETAAAARELVGTDGLETGRGLVGRLARALRRETPGDDPFPPELERRLVQRATSVLAALPEAAPAMNAFRKAHAQGSTNPVRLTEAVLSSSEGQTLIGVGQDLARVLEALVDDLGDALEGIDRRGAAGALAGTSPAGARSSRRRPRPSPRPSASPSPTTSTGSRRTSTPASGAPACGALPSRSRSWWPAISSAAAAPSS